MLPTRLVIIIGSLLYTIDKDIVSLMHAFFQINFDNALISEINMRALMQSLITLILLPVHHFSQINQILP